MIDFSFPSRVPWPVASVLTVSAPFAGAAPASTQEVALVHGAGERIGVAERAVDPMEMGFSSRPAMMPVGGS